MEKRGKVEKKRRREANPLAEKLANLVLLKNVLVYFFAHVSPFSLVLKCVTNGRHQFPTDSVKISAKFRSGALIRWSNGFAIFRGAIFPLFRYLESLARSRLLIKNAHLSNQSQPKVFFFFFSLFFFFFFFFFSFFFFCFFFFFRVLCFSKKNILRSHGPTNFMGMLDAEC